MIPPIGVGVVGCGMTAGWYVRDSSAFAGWRPVACTDLDAARAVTFAAAHGLRAVGIDELLADPALDLVLNVTPPTAHAPIVRAALEAGKHVYTEKPLAATTAEARELVAEAERRNLRLGCAPDTFLGSAYETGRRLVEDGMIGVPLGASARMLGGGAHTWHPNAEVFYRAGGGPLLDTAPYYLTALVSLLGPIAAVSGFAATPTREHVLHVGPRAGERVTVEVPTHVSAVIRHKHGALATLTTSFEAANQYLSGLEVWGSDGSLLLPDATEFRGDVLLRRGRRKPRRVRVRHAGRREARGLGLEDLAAALHEGREHRADGSLALHVLEAAEAIARAADEGVVVTL